VTRLAVPAPHAAQQLAAALVAFAAFATLNPDWPLIGTDARHPAQRERMRRWERNRLLGRRTQEALAEENDGSHERRRQAVEARARSALDRTRHPGPHVPRPPTPQARPGPCPWKRCDRPATDLIEFAPPHPLAGQQRGYCTAHAVEASLAPGASLAGSRPAPAQLTLPGIGEPAQP
jgi:hypothetical protein